jgi:hypothetical protein
MANEGLRPGTELVNVLKEVYGSEWAANPTEEAVIAGFVHQPNGVSRIGNKLHLPKVATIAATTLGSTSSGNSLTQTQNTEVDTTYSPTAKYSYVGINAHAKTRIINDGAYQAVVRKQMLAGLEEAIDTDLFTLAASLSHTESGADVDKTMLLSAIGQLAEFGKGHIKVGQTDLMLVVHPREIKNVLATNEFVNAQFRGDSSNPAVKGWVANAYGVTMRESGLVYNPAGTAYQPLLEKMAWVLAWNQKPTVLDVQQYQLETRLIAWCEYAVGEFFDQYGVSLNTTV